MDPTQPLNMRRADVDLLCGCYHEAERSDAVRARLDALRKAMLDRNSRSPLAETIEELRRAAKVLRELADLSQVHHSHIAPISDSLNVVLPCLSRTLRDVEALSVDRSVAQHRRWRNMCSILSQEAGGRPLPARFGLYNYFAVSLRDLMTRSSSFDAVLYQSQRLEILQLRDARGIPPPSVQPGVSSLLDAILSAPMDHGSHWAQRLFWLPLPTRTTLQRRTSPSKLYGSHNYFGYVRISSYSRFLFRRTFDKDQLSLVMFLGGREQVPYLLLRIFESGKPWFALQPIHKVCVERGSTSIRLKRWSQSEGHSKLWACLYFTTWEDLVLVHCAFLSLKVRSPMTVRLGAEEYNLPSESLLFEDIIVDNGHEHSLIVYEDRKTKGIRLHASICGGHMFQCPVWTAFVTYSAISPTWLRRVSRHMIHLAELQQYVFCPDYRQMQDRRRSYSGTQIFEISFLHEQACKRFELVFSLLRRTHTQPAGFAIH